MKLESDTGALRNLLANAATLMVKLKEVAAPPPAPLAATVAEEVAAASSAAGDWEQTPDGLRCAWLCPRQCGRAPAQRCECVRPSCSALPADAVAHFMCGSKDGAGRAVPASCHACSLS